MVIREREISGGGNLTILTGWFDSHKEGHHCYFSDKNTYRTEGFEIIRSFRKSKEQLRADVKELQFERNVISVIIEELLKTDEVKDYFEAKGKLSSLNGKLDRLYKELY